MDKRLLPILFILILSLLSVPAAAGYIIEEFCADALVVSNIGVPSKELYAAAKRPGNFYMLGSYMQASAIGLGCALGCPAREVFVLDVNTFLRGGKHDRY